MIFEEIGSLFVNVAALSDWRYWVMWAIGGLLIYLAIAKDMEPTLHRMDSLPDSSRHSGNRLLHL